MSYQEEQEIHHTESNLTIFNVKDCKPDCTGVSMPSQLQPVPIPPPSDEVDAYFANVSNEDPNYDDDTELSVEEEI